VLQTHPRVVVGNMVCKNFYYTPPDQFTAEDDAETDVERMLNNLHEFERSEQELRRSRVEVKEANSHLEEKVQKRTRELEHKTQELQNLNRNLAGREYRIRELEREVALLRARITRGPE
ncbi:MAG: hypothetical protein K0S68_430, partial [Candidatus Saccharibacteria bacterium]|nr:hypothetical protein [Candidatus Saccharibacteria bacterium]